ncbi:MAG: hypothetical protein ACUVRM_09555 [Bacillota bacterium]
MSHSSDRERLWELERAVRKLAAHLPMSAPEVLALAEEADTIINRLMGIRGPGEKKG